MSLKAQRIDAEVLKLIQSEIARKYNIIPIDKIGKFITIAMANPMDDEVCAQVGKITGLRVQRVASTQKDIEEAIERYYPATASETLAEDKQPVEQADLKIKLESIEDILLSAETEGQLKGRIPKDSTVHSQRGGETAIADERFVAEYTFNNFIQDGDVEALRAAIHICNIEKVMYNPLLIYAKEGLGKTHLLHAIGNYITQKAPQKNIEYINCRELSLRMMNADAYEICTELCENWSLLNILLFDDFQALLAEKINREAFMFIFDFLYQKRAQMVIASSPLDAVDYEIETSLLSRIESGLTVNIKPPNVETQLIILRKWEEIEDNGLLSDMDLKSIAEQTYENVRQLLSERNRLRFQTLLLQKS